HSHAKVTGDGEVVDRREMKDFVDWRQVDSRSDVAFDNAHAIAELAGALPRKRREFALHQTDRRHIGKAAQHARQKRRSEEAGIAGEEDFHVAICRSIAARPSVTRASRS